MNRSVAGPLLQYIKSLAIAENLSLEADFKSNGRNRQMLITYRFAGFKPLSEDSNTEIKRLIHDEPSILLAKDHIKVTPQRHREKAVHG